MKELKFRVWDRIRKCFFIPTYEAHKGKLKELLISLDGELMLRTPNNLVHESGPVQIMDLLRINNLR
jgi:hypothetical protein